MWLINDAQYRHIFIGQGNENRPGRRAGNKTARPVNGIERPGPAIAAFQYGKLLAQHAVFRAFDIDEIAHGLLGGPVCNGDRIKAGTHLVLDRCLPAEMR